MIKKLTFAPLLGLLLIVACEDAFDIEDPNNAALEDLITNPTRAGIAAAATGLLVTVRDEYDDRNGMVSLMGILGRESYNFDGSDPRFITEMLEGDLNPSSPAFGGNLWGERYSNLRTGSIILFALDAISDAEVLPEEKEATRAYTKTMMAHELLITINAHDVNGAVIDVPADPSEDPGPIVTKQEVLTRIEQWLDEADDHLSNSGDAFPFTLTSGFIGFDTPTTFRQFNRALAARVDVYMNDYGEALTNLGESFLNLAASLDLGVYVVFSTFPGDEPNELFDPGTAPDIVAHPSLVSDAQVNSLSEPDLRLGKLRSIDPRTRLGITTDVAFTLYPDPGSPIPFIRNEELILLRAEANIGLGSIGPAITDLNFIRTTSGGLDARTDLDATNIEDELVYNRRYSLMFEGGHRWIDARRLDRIDELPLDTPNSQVNTAFPIPEAECLARGLDASLGGACQ
jgi:hypothetical protein